jgi:hypothetical protein
VSAGLRLWFYLCTNLARLAPAIIHRNYTEGERECSHGRHHVPFYQTQTETKTHGFPKPITAVVPDFRVKSARLRSQLHASVMVLLTITMNFKKWSEEFGVEKVRCMEFLEKFIFSGITIFDLRDKVNRSAEQKAREQF